MKLTPALLKRLALSAAPARLKAICDTAPTVLPKYGITTPLRMAHFFAQLAHESGDRRSLAVRVVLTASHSPSANASSGRDLIAKLIACDLALPDNTCENCTVERGPPVTPKDVAKYMLDKMGDSPWLYQEIIVTSIRHDCGADFVYTNENGNLAIDKAVLRAFRKLTEQTLIWERGEKAWRRRTESDKPTRQQD